MKVLITCRQMQVSLPEHQAAFDAHGIELVVPPVVQQLSENELKDLISDADGIIAGDDPLTAEVIDAAPKLRVISKWGVGTDGIDKNAAAKRGVVVTNTPDVFGEEVADVVIGYLVLLARRLHEIDRDVRAGGWFKPAGFTLAEKTFGIVGLGSIGRAVGRRAVAARMSVIGADPDRDAAQKAAVEGIEVRTLDDVLADCDVLSINCPLVSETYHLLDAEALSRTRPGIYIINTARGPIIDEAALVSALETGQVAGAALDVFEEEPLPSHSPLRRFDQLIFGSHNGSNTAEAVRRVSAMAVENLLTNLQAS